MFRTGAISCRRAATRISGSGVSSTKLTFYGFRGFVRESLKALPTMAFELSTLALFFDKPGIT